MYIAGMASTGLYSAGTYLGVPKVSAEVIGAVAELDR